MCEGVKEAWANPVLNPLNLPLLCLEIPIHVYFNGQRFQTA
jgi:hypothetical protein